MANPRITTAAIALIVVTTLGDAGSALADSAPDSTALAEEARALCEELAKTKVPNPVSATWKNLMRDLGILASPAPFSHPSKPIEVEIPEAMRVRSPGAGFGINAIFSVAPPEAGAEWFERPEVKARHKQLEREIKALQKQLRRLARSKSVAQCLERQRETGFRWIELATRMDEHLQLDHPRRHKEGRMAANALRRAIKDLKLGWIVYETTDLRAVRDALRSGLYANVILVSHGRPDGKLVDSALNLYPQGFFEEIAPSVLSVSFFSCYSGLVSEHYRIAERLAASPSVHPARYSFHVSHGKAADGSMIAPLPGVGHFLERVDAFLAEKMRASREYQLAEGERLPAAPAAERCAVQVSGLEVTRGAFGILVNNTYVGSVNRGEKGAHVSFACSLLDRPASAIVTRDLSMFGNSAAAPDAQPALKLVAPEGRFGVKEFRNYAKDDGSYRSSKLVITRN